MVTKLIETAVEIEGLLRVLKDGEPSDELYSLLTEKTLWLAEECDRLASEYDSQKTAQSVAEESQAEAEVASDEEAEAEEATAEAYQAPEEPEKDEEAPASETQTEDETEPEEEEQPEKEPHKEEDTHSEEDAEEEQSAGVDTAADADAEAEEESSEDYLQMDDDSYEEDDEEDDDILLNIDDEEEEEPAAIAEQPKHEHIQKPKPNLKAFFSLNDRFLYARELFDGDMKMFDATLRQLEGIEYFSDIEDYFFNELEWDPERRFVSQYMDTLRPHFK